MKIWRARIAAVGLCMLAACGPRESMESHSDKPSEQTPSPPSPKPEPPEHTTLPAPLLRLTPHRITLANGKSFTLGIPEGFEISVAAQGLHRLRFMAKSPDARIFVTDMHNLGDNNNGAVYALDGFDAETGTFASVTPYLRNLRNPNSLAFHADKDGNRWLYLALTDKLVRYAFHEGDESPGPPQTLATYPDYGLGYKYGGWHLSRTVAIGPDGKVHVSVGSSCNACVEKEAIRATVSVMDPDGANPQIIARGLRNAVGMAFAGRTLFVTGMGADHLGDDRPEETMYAIVKGANYGWPSCYVFQSENLPDDKAGLPGGGSDCGAAPLPYATFPAHSAPLGLEYFDLSAETAALRNSFLVALHGSSVRKLGKGYSIVRVAQDRPPENFIVGFQEGEEVFGRPAGILRIGPDAFLFTDDHAGVVYYVRPARTP
jgi:glucose/arabinose dehydrogenase